MMINAKGKRTTPRTNTSISEHTASMEDKPFDDSVQSKVTYSVRSSTSTDWRSSNARMALLMRGSFLDGSQRRCAGVDDEEGKAQFFLILLFQSIEDSAAFFAGTIFFLVMWSILCTYVASVLCYHAQLNPGGAAEILIQDIEECKTAVSIIGTLFVFMLAFHFNVCYNHWWESRIYWGDIISNSLELGMMNRRWFAGTELQDKMSRFIVVFSYACKSLLRGKSLKHEGEDGASLVQKGLLSQQELDLLHNSPCWQPHFCLDMIREIILQAHMIPDGKGLHMDDTNKVHGQLFRCLDNSIKELSTLIGNCVRVRASGLPTSYDAITMTGFVAFLPSCIGSLVHVRQMDDTPHSICRIDPHHVLDCHGYEAGDPFGTDKVNIPIEDFCATIEAQILAIDERSQAVSEMVRAGEKRVLRRSVATFRIPKLA